MVEFGPATFTVIGPESGRYDGLPVSGPITDTFNNLTPFRIQNNLGPHGGVDISAPEGTEIHAPAEGVVEIVAFHHDLGNYLCLRHADNTYSGYCHMREPSPLQRGQQVARGDFLGRVGMTGTVTGPHLHWIHTVVGNSALNKAAGFVNALDSVRAVIGGVSVPPVVTVTETVVAGISAGLAAAAVTYTVVSGDNLTKLSGLWGCSIQQICDLNNLPDADHIFIGQVLKRP
jgi:hypothetical protein